VNLLPFSYQIRLSERATKTRIVVTTDKIEVVAPPGISQNSLHRFVLAQQEWILKALDKIRLNASKHKKLSPDSYVHGARIPYLGSTFPLVTHPSKLKKIKIEFSEGFIAHIPEPLLSMNYNNSIKLALTAWMKKQLMLKVEQIIQQHGPKKSLFPRRITIKSQKSRWGSCGIHNDITINWLLILAPLSVIEYVVVHELCHIQIKNHSSDFWNLVAHHLPDFQSQRRWLKHYGPSLMSGL
jgi:predicted metal-dependent hydrolase